MRTILTSRGRHADHVSVACCDDLVLQGFTAQKLAEFVEDRHCILCDQFIDRCLQRIPLRHSDANGNVHNRNSPPRSIEGPPGHTGRAVLRLAYRQVTAGTPPHIGSFAFLMKFCSNSGSSPDPQVVGQQQQHLGELNEDYGGIDWDQPITVLDLAQMS